MTNFLTWAIHVFFYWIVPIPILIIVEIVLRKFAIGKKKTEGIDFQFHYRIATFIPKVRKIPIIGRGISALADIIHQGTVYTLVIKEGKRQWRTIHPKRLNAQTVNKSSERQKKSVPNAVQTLKN